MNANAKGNPAPSTVVFCYARVSTQEQEDHGHSLDEQGSRLRAYCKAHGLEPLEVVYENGSAKTVARRAGLKRILRELRAGRAGGIVVAKLDRLSRSVRDVLDLIDASGREGWTLHSIADSLDTSTAMGKFVVTLMAGLAQMEREQTGERTKAALDHLRRQGRRTSGKAPFGYRFNGGREIPVPSEQRLLARMQELRAQGLGARKIVSELGDTKNPRTGKTFSVGTVAAVLKTAARRAATLQN